MVCHQVEALHVHENSPVVWCAGGIQDTDDGERLVMRVSIHGAVSRVDLIADLEVCLPGHHGTDDGFKEAVLPGVCLEIASRGKFILAICGGAKLHRAEHVGSCPHDPEGLVVVSQQQRDCQVGELTKSAVPHAWQVLFRILLDDARCQPRQQPGRSTGDPHSHGFLRGPGEFPVKIMGVLLERVLVVRLALCLPLELEVIVVGNILNRFVQDADGAGETGQAAFPMGKGSGSVTTFSRADGFITIGEQHEIVEAGEQVEVQLLGQDIRAADLVVIGSHCIGLDVLLGEMNSQGMNTKLMSVGSQAGLEAARRGQCDLAGIHLLDEATGEYNIPFLDDSLLLIPGYLRQQGILFRPDDARLAGNDLDQLRERIATDDQLRMVNRNQGSGTRILIDQLLDGRRPDGYAVQPRSHNAVAAAIVRGSADWGVGIEQVATASMLGFIPLAEEHYDFVCPAARRSREAVELICQLLQDAGIRSQLAALGLTAK